MMFSSLGLAPLARSRPAISTLPRAAAIWSGVRPSAVSTFGSAPSPAGRRQPAALPHDGMMEGSAERVLCVDVCARGEQLLDLRGVALLGGVMECVGGSYRDDGSDRERGRDARRKTKKRRPVRHGLRPSRRAMRREDQDLSGTANDIALMLRRLRAGKRPRVLAVEQRGKAPLSRLRCCDEGHATASSSRGLLPGNIRNASSTEAKSEGSATAQ